MLLHNYAWYVIMQTLTNKILLERSDVKCELHVTVDILLCSTDRVTGSNAAIQKITNRTGSPDKE